MSEPTLEKLERRVAALERTMTPPQNPQPPGWKDWRQALGHFTPSELSEEVDAAGREIREVDRRKAAS